ncbi:MAG: FAD-dependent thymidylate synthase [Gammaproteobacteria bacterium]|nr:FAD-dependent thymidylate synthase [Gammaproteobacteria bacterium]
MKVEYIDHLGSDLTVVNSARISVAKWKDVFDEKDAKLLAYLAREEHVSPFFHGVVQLRITAPIAIARQWWRSVQGVARNETSRRYVSDPPEVFYPSAWRSRPEGSIKQGSGADLDEIGQMKASASYEYAVDACLKAYERLLDLGVAPEQARFVLPQSMLTQWIESGSVAYYARVYKLRVDHHAQGEIQDLARMMADVVGPLFPESWEVLTE